MSNIKILCVGKIKEKFYRDAIAEYEKRLSRYCKLSVIEVADEKTPDKSSEAEEQQIKEKEAARLMAHIRDNDYVIALAIDGKTFDSVAFANHMGQLAVSGKSNLVFVIGGSFGLHPSIKEFAAVKLSMSPMTFPHHLARVMLLEQIYRAYQINAGTKYHK